jgi:hypothetical protein
MRQEISAEIRRSKLKGLKLHLVSPLSSLATQRCVSACLAKGFHQLSRQTTHNIANALANLASNNQYSSIIKDAIDLSSNIEEVSEVQRIVSSNNSLAQISNMV